LPKKSLSHLKDIDDVWTVAMERAEQAGKLLALTLLRDKQERQIRRNALLRERQSLLLLDVCTDTAEKLRFCDEQLQTCIVRPVTLIGFGMGARLIAHALLCLYDQPNCVGEGVVENAVLLGAPLSASKYIWRSMRQVVANRLINVYSRLDWLLALLYRSVFVWLCVFKIIELPVVVNCCNLIAERSLGSWVLPGCSRCTSWMTQTVVCLQVTKTRWLCAEAKTTTC
jgi:hypothetical protein